MLEFTLLICSIPFLLLFVLYAWERRNESEERIEKLEERIRELEEKE